jgi:alkylation response protein AidB-like acyl-CoA dehydrogenase
MDFVLSDDQVDLQEELRRFLSGRVTSEVRRAAMARPGAIDRDLWQRVATMGVFALTVPEADGGVDLGMADAAVVFEELGRVAMSGPLIPTFLAAGVVDGAAWGETVVGLVPAGAPAMVEHLDGLDALLVLDGADVRLASSLPGGVPVDRPLDPLTPITVVDHLPDGSVVLDGDDVRRRGGLLAAAFQVGLGQAALELGTGYAAQREQFGRTIGSFQAVKHLLADTAVAIETARAGVHAAAVTYDEGSDADRLVHGARIVASGAAERSARACIQVHGGMGYTWELDAHLLLKRSLVLDQAFGGTAAAVDALAASL